MNIKKKLAFKNKPTRIIICATAIQLRHIHHKLHGSIHIVMSIGFGSHITSDGFIHLWRYFFCDMHKVQLHFRFGNSVCKMFVKWNPNITVIHDFINNSLTYKIASGECWILTLYCLIFDEVNFKRQPNCSVQKVAPWEQLIVKMKHTLAMLGLCAGILCQHCVISCSIGSGHPSIRFGLWPENSQLCNWNSGISILLIQLP